jgi:hypothetical protein
MPGLTVIAKAYDDEATGMEELKPSEGASAKAAGAEIIGPKFDYTSLSAIDAQALMEAADRIRFRTRRQIEDIIQTGRDLLEIKAKVRHGQFTRWLISEFSWSDRTAQNYMNVATAFAGKTETVSGLPPRILYRLAAPSTPAAIRDSIIAKAESGQPITPELVAETVRSRKQSRAERRADDKPSRAPAPQDQDPGTAPMRVEEDASRLVDLLVKGLGGNAATLQEIVKVISAEAWARAYELISTKTC